MPEIIEQCVVEKVKKNTYYIKLVAQAKCNGCKACGFGRSKSVVIPATSLVSCVKGDKVSVRMPQKQIKAAAVIMYVIPLVCFFCGLLLGKWQGEAFMFLYGGILLAAGFVIVALIDRAYRRKPIYLPQIIEKISDDIKEKI